MRINASKPEPISALEPVAASQLITKYEKENQQNLPHPYSEKSNKNKSWKYFTATQTVLIETSVYGHLGKNINIQV